MDARASRVVRHASDLRGPPAHLRNPSRRACSAQSPRLRDRRPDMRDLTARLRDIVRQDHGGHAAGARRELTYVPDVAASSLDPSAVAAALGGTFLDPHGGCIVVDRVWAPEDHHGRRPVRSFAPRADAAIALFDPRAGNVPDWSRRIVFFDL